MTDTTQTPVAVILQALRYLAARCDGAHEQDGAGFNKPDSWQGKQWAAKPVLNETEVMLALDTLKKYEKSQLASAGITLPERESARDDALALVSLAGKIVADGPDHLKVSFLYNERFVKDINTIASARFNGADKTWRVARTHGKDLLVVFPRFEIDAALRDSLEHGPVDLPPAGRLTLVGKQIAVSFEYDPDKVKRIKTVPGARFDGATKRWTVAVEQAARLVELFPDFVLDPALTDHIAGQQAAQAADAVLGAALTSRIVPDLNEGKRAMDHQMTGAKQMVEMRRMILADEMGLGKSICSLMAAKAYQLPIVVIGPVSVAINWQREAAVVGVQITYCSYAKIPAKRIRVGEHFEYVSDIDHDFVLIADEAHAFQSVKAQRTQKFLALAKSQHCKGCYPLTGTPLKNGRPVNLYPLLAAIQHPIAANRSHYETRYCDAHATRWSKWDVSGASNLDELHTLTKPCILRRLKKDCLDLPLKTRVVRGVDLSEQTEKAYNLRIDTLRKDYRERVANGQISKKGDALTMLTIYRQSGSIAKADTAIELAQELIETDQQVVIFVSFKESGNIIAKMLGCKLLSGDSSVEERQQMVDDFQAGVTRAIVCTHGAGGVGITLTAAQTVILVDRPWTSGDAVQAEDRLHRKGQRNAVTAIWLQLGDVDIMIDELLQDKQERIDLVLQGKRKTLRGVNGSPADMAAELLPLIFD